MTFFLTNLCNSANNFKEIDVKATLKYKIKRAFNRNKNNGEATDSSGSRTQILRIRFSKPHWECRLKLDKYIFKLHIILAFLSTIDLRCYFCCFSFRNHGLQDVQRNKSMATLPGARSGHMNTV